MNHKATHKLMWKHYQQTYSINNNWKLQTAVSISIN